MTHRPFQRPPRRLLHRPPRRPPRRPLLTAAAALLLSSLVGCAQTRTIGQAGFPVFEPIVGAERDLVVPDGQAGGGLHLYDPDTVNEDADHTPIISFLPDGTDERVGFMIRGRAKGRLKLERIACAAYAVSRQQGETFGQSGQLPPEAQALKVETEAERDAQGNLVLFLVLERASLPEGAERLALPTLFHFADGWSYVRYYHSGIPEPRHLLTPEDIESLRRGGAPGEGQAPAGPQPPPAGPQPPPAGPQPPPAGPQPEPGAEDEGGVKEPGQG